MAGLPPLRASLGRIRLLAEDKLRGTRSLFRSLLAGGCSAAGNIFGRLAFRQRAEPACLQAVGFIRMQMIGA